MEIQEETRFRPIRKEQELKEIPSLPFGNLQAKISLPCVIDTLVKGQRSHYPIYISPFTNDRIPLYPFFTGTLFLPSFYGNSDAYRFFNERGLMALM